jgi:hypothetical protein
MWFNSAFIGLRQILILSSHLHLRLFKVSLLLFFRHRTFSGHATIQPTSSPSFYCWNNTWIKVQRVKLLAITFPHLLVTSSHSSAPPSRTLKFGSGKEWTHIILLSSACQLPLLIFVFFILVITLILLWAVTLLHTHTHTHGNMFKKFKIVCNSRFS